MVCSDPKLSETGNGTAVKTAYCLRRAGSSATTTAGSLVLHPSSLRPPLEWCENQNLFQHLFGIKFHYEGHTYVQPFLSFKFARCFYLLDNIQYRLSHADYKFALDVSMPELTSRWLFTQINETLELLRAVIQRSSLLIRDLRLQPQFKHYSMVQCA